MRILLLLLPLLLAGCSSAPSGTTPTTGTLVVKPATAWPYGQSVRFAMAEQYQYAGASVEGWLTPIQEAVEQKLKAHGWQPQTMDDADLLVAVGVAGAADLSNAEIFSRLGMTPGQITNKEQRAGTLAVVLLDRQSERPVWSATLQLEVGDRVPDEERVRFSQRWVAQMLATLPGAQ
ncbi:DUF4136 domain-containing protein [Aeromonas diversa]|uniref:DUF4136 domain-containing protein n=1 Tax=Aeromonas diversa TaxID=502790 RepID=UPI0039A159C6